MRRVPRGFWLACTALFLLGFGLRMTLDTVDSADPPAGVGGDSTAGILLDLVSAESAAPRTVAVYRGLGAWVDAFDFSPTYTRSADVPPISPDDVADMAAHGVTTLYLQAARPDERSSGRLLEEPLLAEFLVRAHAHGIRVVGWYLPLFIDVDKDLDHLLAIAEFEALGHRFDGVAVDIESQEGVTDPRARSARLVELSERLRAERPGESIGAIVLPTVQIEVVNTTYWPDFPWSSIRPHYDVWLPMAYSTYRTVESGYRDPYRYAEESVRRMRANLGDPDAPVHVVGGIGELMSPEDFVALGAAAVDTGSIGSSVYDWDSMSVAQRRDMADALAPP